MNQFREAHGIAPLPTNEPLPRLDHKPGSARVPGITLNLPRCKPRGLGDTVAAFTEATGIAAAVKAVSKLTGRPCGCAKRQEALNKLVPYQQ